MSEWKRLIDDRHPVWSGIKGYCEERIADHTRTCTNPDSSDLQIRQAQEAISELRRLLAMPDTLKTTAQVKQSSANKRGEY